MRPGNAAVNASTVLLTRGREDLEAARRALSEFDQRSRARSQASPSTQEQAEENRRLQDERLLLERQVRRAEQFYKAYVDRHASMGTDQDTHTSNPSQGLLNPPQGFMIIDAPNDPQVAENSRFLIAAVVFAAFTILALVMAVIAELLDTRIRRPEELTALTALPVLARLPRASSDGSAHAPSYSTSGRPAAS